MKKYKGAVDSIESFGLVDGPGIRTVIFLSGCKLRCKYCHNPEMQIMAKPKIDLIFGKTMAELHFLEETPYYK